MFIQHMAEPQMVLTLTPELHIQFSLLQQLRELLIQPTNLRVFLPIALGIGKEIGECPMTL